MYTIANADQAPASAALTRRGLFKLGGLATAAVAGASLAGCAPQAGTPTAATGEGSAAVADGTPSFLVPPAPITEFDETRDYEVVVVGEQGEASVTIDQMAETLGTIQHEVAIGFGCSRMPRIYL